MVLDNLILLFSERFPEQSGLKAEFSYPLEIEQWVERRTSLVQLLSVSNIAASFSSTFLFRNILVFDLLQIAEL